MAIKQMELWNGSLTIGAEGAPTSFSSQLTKVVLKPSVNTGDPRYVLSGETAPGERTETWALEGTLIQDFGTDAATALTEFCFTNRGKPMPFDFVPNGSSTKGVRGTLTVEAVDIGGDVKTNNESDFGFTLVGEPELYGVGEDGGA